MANDKKFVVKNGLQAQNASFVSPDTTNSITMEMTDIDVLSWSGDAGQLFSISDSLTGVIFSVNDISGMPSIEVEDDGSITMAEYSGGVGIGGPPISGAFSVQQAGNLLPTFVSTDDQAVQLRLQSDSTNRRINARTAAGTVVGQIEFTDTNIEFYGDTTATNPLTVGITSGDVSINSGRLIAQADGDGVAAELFGRIELRQPWADANEGGEIQFNPGTSFTNVHIIDQYQQNLRFFTNHASDVYYTFNNVGAGSAIVDITGSLRFGGSGTYVSSILDEDTMASNSATALCTQQSIKAYVDANGGGITVSDDNSSSSSFYPTMSSATSGSISTETVSSTKMYFQPSTGTLNTYVFNSLSDVNEKENIETLPDALENVKRLRGVSFTFKNTEQRSLGVIAQEMEQVYPEVVNTSGEGRKSVAYGNLVGVLIEAIKQLEQRVADLELQLESK